MAKGRESIFFCGEHWGPLLPPTIEPATMPSGRPSGKRRQDEALRECIGTNYGTDEKNRSAKC